MDHFTLLGESLGKTSHGRAMAESKTIIRTKKGPREYSYLGCPLTRNRSAWCFRLCAPDAEGHGRCGRIAPHSLKSNIQSAIEKHGKKKLEKRFRDLETAYLEGPGKGLRGVGIRIDKGEADVVLPTTAKDRDPSGGIHDSVCFKVMNDSAAQAVKSLFDDANIKTSEFSVTLTHAKATGDLVARGRYVGRAGGNYLADAMVTDSEGTEVGRGEGVFFELPELDSE